MSRRGLELHRLLNDPNHKEAVLAECAINKGRMALNTPA